MADSALPPRAPILDKLLGVLLENGVDFVVIGGMAGIARGSSFPSFDLDIFYRRDRANIARLVKVLEELEVRLRGAPDDVPFILDAKTIENGANFTFATPYGDFDVLADVAGIASYAEVIENASEERIAGVIVWVASIDHLIAMKRAANRTKDQIMLEEYIVIADEQRKVEEEESG